MTQSLCWDCKKAVTCECSWADNFTPVEGWKAVPTVKKPYKGRPMKSFLVYECPEFERDATDGGLKRLGDAGEVVIKLCRKRK